MNHIDNSTTYINFAKNAYEEAKKLLTDYGSKFSRKDFVRPQLLALAGFKERFRLKWRELEEILIEMPRIRKILELKKVPDFSTIPKFLKRIGHGIFNRFFKPEKCELIGIDATGFSSTTASPHYEKRCGKRRPYLKASIAVDLKTLIIQAVKIRKRHAHDSRDFIPLANKCKFEKVVADKAYDDEKLHRHVHKLGCESIIPVRDRKRKKVKGKHRKELAEDFDKPTYNQRSKAESTISVTKRVEGEDVCARSTNMQKRMLKVKFWAYNIDRKFKLFVLSLLKASFFWLVFIGGNP